MRPTVSDFRELVGWLAQTYHGGHFYPISKRAGVSSAIVDQWKHGVTKSPKVDTIFKLATAYDLEPAFLMELVAGRRPLPKPSRRGRKFLAGLLLALTTGGVLPATGTPALADDAVRLIGSWRRKRMLTLGYAAA